MTRTFVSTLAAASIAFLTLGAAPALAAAPTYRAELAAPTSSTQLIARGQMWKCNGDGCVAGKSNSRPAVACAALAREAGALRSFSVQGRALSAADLQKCNAKAR